MVVRDAPLRVVRGGFVGVGDAVTPGEHSGILPSVYLSRTRSGDIKTSIPSSAK